MAATPQQLMQYLVANGMSPVGAQGLVARWQQESGQRLDPAAVGDRSIPGASQGIGQWNRDRLANLRAGAGGQWTDPYAQADFALSELGIGKKHMPGYGSESAAGRMLMSAQTPEQAVAGGMAYERPQGWQSGHPELGHGYSNTIRNYSALAGGAAFDPNAPVPARPNPTGPQAATDAASPGNPAMNQQPTEAPQQFGPYLPPRDQIAAAKTATPPQKTTWQDMIAKMASGFGKSMGGGNIDASIPNRPVAQTYMTALPASPMFDPNAVAAQRDQLAQALARLNSGQLYG